MVLRINIEVGKGENEQDVLRKIAAEFKTYHDAGEPLRTGDTGFFNEEGRTIGEWGVTAH